MGVRTAWPVKQHRDYLVQKLGRLFEAEKLTASDCRLASQQISALHRVQSTGQTHHGAEWK